MKIYVYAIAKNESKFVEKWIESMKEADGIYVMLDATSTDDTYDLLVKHGVNVTKKLIAPWRFDDARNFSLSLVPEDADICVCTDLDEEFSPGWRKILEEKWTPGTTKAVYKYYHNANSSDQTPNIFDYYKIHDRHSYIWKWPIHEYIVPKDGSIVEKDCYLDGVMLYHYPDLTKSRSSYSKLLKLGVDESPDDMRLLSLYIESLVGENDFDTAKKLIIDAIENKIQKHKHAIVDNNLIFKMAISLAKKQGDYKLALRYCFLALAYTENCRTFYCELAECYMNLNENEIAISLFKKALDIKSSAIPGREAEWIDDAKIFNIMSICYYNLENYNKAQELVDRAIDLANEKNYLYSTLIANKEIYDNKLIISLAEKISQNNQ